LAGGYRRLFFSSRFFLWTSREKKLNTSDKNTFKKPESPLNTLCPVLSEYQTLSCFFFLRKKRNKKALVTALPKGISFGHGPAAADFLPFTRSSPKNTNSLRSDNAVFFNGKNSVPLRSADATKKSKAVTHHLSLKAALFTIRLCLLCRILTVNAIQKMCEALVTVRLKINSGSSDGMPPRLSWKGRRQLLAGGYSSSFFSLGFFLELARKKSNILLSKDIQMPS